MSKVNSYYLAIKISDAEAVLLTSVPCIEPWDEKIERISFNDPMLKLDGMIINDYSHPIYLCSTPSQILYAIKIWLSSADLRNIINVLPRIKSDQNTNDLVMSIVHKKITDQFLIAATPGEEFLVDQLYHTFGTRNFPINDRSSQDWKKIFISSYDDSNNCLIRIAKSIIMNFHSEPDQYSEITRPVEENKIGDSFDKLLKFTAEQKLKPQIEQFMAWVAANHGSFRPGVTEKIFNLCVNIVTGKGSSGLRRQIERKYNSPEYKSMDFDTRGLVISTLGFLISIGQDAMFMEFMCRFLISEKFLFLIQNPKLMGYLNGCMEKNLCYRSLVQYSLTYALSHAATLEATSRVGTNQSPFVLMHDMILNFPIFEDPAAYVPFGVKDISANTPFHIPGERRPVTMDQIEPRLNAALVRDGSVFSILTDIPWNEQNLILTGSRYASALWVGPREREIYFGDYKKYIAEYIGHSTAELDAILNLVDPSGDTCLDILGTDFDSGIVIHEIPESIPLPTMAPKGLTTIMDEITKSIVAKPENESKTSEMAAAAIGTQPVTPEVKTPVITNQSVRDIFCKLKFAGGWNNHSDIDIGFFGSQDDFDTAASRLVTNLRKFGRAVALKFQKPRTYTWTIVTDFLNFTIDLFFIHQRSPINLILNYMTSYPKCWFDGISHYGTVEYMCARMSGINSRYTYTMNNPIYTLMKSARREDISIVLNFKEQVFVRRWLEKHMPDLKLKFGNVALTNKFFDQPGAIIDNGSRPWITEPMRMPRTRMQLKIWSTENAGALSDPDKVIIGKKIITPDPNMFSTYIQEIKDLARDH